MDQNSLYRVTARKSQNRWITVKELLQVLVVYIKHLEVTDLIATVADHIMEVTDLISGVRDQIRAVTNIPMEIRCAIGVPHQGPQGCLSDKGL